MNFHVSTNNCEHIWSQLCPDVSVQVPTASSNDMSENHSRDMGVKFAASLNRGEDLCYVLHILKQ